MNSLTSFVDHPIWFERAFTVTHVTPSGLERVIDEAALELEDVV